MSLIKWTDDFVTGIGAIDEQHRQLVDIVNRFDEALRKDRGPRTLNRILDDLLGYTQEHFADEERRLADAGYTELKQHQAAHRRLLQKLERFQFDFGRQQPPAPAAAREFLQTWLTAHIREDDRRYIPALKPEAVGS